MPDDTKLKAAMHSVWMFDPAYQALEEARAAKRAADRRLSEVQQEWDRVRAERPEMFPAPAEPTMPDDIKLPEPHCYIYEWDSHFGTSRSTNRSRWNGRKPDRSFPLYTADQVRAAVEADRAQRIPLTDEQIDAAVRPLGFAQLDTHEVARAIERAHGIAPPEQEPAQPAQAGRTDGGAA